MLEAAMLPHILNYLWFVKSEKGDLNEEG
jgi:hypothetical protein